MRLKTNIKDKIRYHVPDDKEDLERLQFLDTISRQGIDVLSREELERLHTLIEKKDYSHDPKAQKSKAKLLKKIGNAIYDRYQKHGNSFKTS